MQNKSSNVQSAEILLSNFQQIINSNKSESIQQVKNVYLQLNHLLLSYTNSHQNAYI